MDKRQKAILDAVETIVRQTMKTVNCDYHIDGVIQTVNSNKTYNVKGTSGDVFENLAARTGLTFRVGDIVQICVRNGDFSRKFIDDYRLC